jgi:type III restriction enzyme
MNKTIHFRFDPNQPHQIRPIESTIKLFDGFSSYQSENWMGDEIVPNIGQYDILDEGWLNTNIAEVQEENKINSISSLIHFDDGAMIDVKGYESWRYPQYLIEMETGTGKTYVYLRTVYELRKHYGFRKYLIIVPSIAIYEGVKSAFDTMKSHFASLYGNEPTHLTAYSGQQLSKLRNFATSSFTEILLITVDSFNKKSNNIFKPTEKLPGELLPYEYIQKTHPILILDECQNYTSQTSKEALRTLKPLFSLNYSATPLEKHNLIYRLTPVEAFKQSLVKKIEVLGVTDQYGFADQQLKLSLESIKRASYGLAAELRAFVNRSGEMVEQTLLLKKNDDLFEKTKNEKYKGIIVEGIDASQGVVFFSNHPDLYVDQLNDLTHSKKELFRVQIENTLKHHFEKQAEFRARGIKVLSLFFIDRVANYTDKDGLIKKIFDESFEKMKKGQPYFENLSAEEVREGYFAKKQAKNQTEEFIDTAIEETKKTAAEKELEKAAYQLIMKSKERLLSFDEKVSFIFAHSALKEGWDNPNVFQICTLRQTMSEMRKRQEIGRGMRLAVDQNGERINGDDVNILTVIANESYESYVNNLQTEYVETGDIAPPRPSNATKKHAQRNNKLFNSDDFKHFWQQLCKRTEYRINVDTEELIIACINKLNATQFPEPQIVITRGKFVLTEISIRLVDVQAKLAKIVVEITDTDGNIEKSEKWYSKDKDLSKILNDRRLKGYRIVEIISAGEDSKVVFGDKGELFIGQTIKEASEKGQKLNPVNVHESQTTFPVFNLIDRAAKETNLTRPTILRIFTGMSERSKSSIFKNPEGFANVFISTIKGLLASHIAERIEYYIKKEEEESLSSEDLFPESIKFPQKELIEGSRSSLYDQIQIDSEIEKNFIEKRIKDDERVICYFKFPYRFKIGMPRIIGNYNPDWGIIRWDENEKLKLELVRETKGNIDPNLLQFKNEKRKIDCAKKHFKAIGIDYRQVDDKIINYWEAER